jgi:hypothetical protein
MFDICPPSAELFLADHTAANSHAVLLYSAVHLFNRARARAAGARIKCALLRRTGKLLALDAIAPQQVRSRRYGGLQTIDIDQICGSMGRTGDFDRSFHPLDDRLRSRWISVAMARSQFTPLPPVSLVQVGDLYFVEDGHHRISVARALGESVIDAEVTVWDVHGRLPWEPQVVLQPVLQTA